MHADWINIWPRAATINWFVNKIKNNWFIDIKNICFGLSDFLENIQILRFHPLKCEYCLLLTFFSIFWLFMGQSTNQLMDNRLNGLISNENSHYRKELKAVLSLEKQKNIYFQMTRPWDDLNRRCSKCEAHLSSWQVSRFFGLIHKKFNRRQIFHFISLHQSRTPKRGTLNMDRLHEQLIYPKWIGTALFVSAIAE